MKLVFSNKDAVSHVWASQTQSEGRAGSVFFRDSLIFSYGTHYCSGRIFKAEGYVALNRTKYSNTTLQHVAAARHATTHLRQLWVVDPEAPDKHETQRYLDGLLGAAMKARKQEKRSALLAEAVKLAEDHNTFCKLMEQAKEKVKVPKPPTEEETAAYRAKLRKEAAAAKAKEEKKQAERAAQVAKVVTAWRAGSNETCGFGALPTMLRVKGGQVQTSRSAEIPVAHAKRLWPSIEKVRESGLTTALGMRLGLYELTRINADGSIVVGCHEIPYSEIRGIAEQLGMAEVVPQN